MTITLTVPTKMHPACGGFPETLFIKFNSLKSEHFKITVNGIGIKIFFGHVVKRSVLLQQSQEKFLFSLFQVSSLKIFILHDNQSKKLHGKYDRHNLSKP